MKVAHAAEALGLDVEIHAPGPAHRHCMAAIRNTNYYELGLVHPSDQGLPGPRLRRRLLGLPGGGRPPGARPGASGPGLGVTLDWDYIRAHEAGKTVYE